MRCFGESKHLAHCLPEVASLIGEWGQGADSESIRLTHPGPRRKTYSGAQDFGSSQSSGMPTDTILSGSEPTTSLLQWPLLSTSSVNK